MEPYIPPTLPIGIDIESKAVLKQVALAHRALAKLDGVASTIPVRFDMFKLWISFNIRSTIC